MPGYTTGINNLVAKTPVSLTAVVTSFRRFSLTTIVVDTGGQFCHRYPQQNATQQNEC
jgi:hypothetical protein